MTKRIQLPILAIALSFFSLATHNVFANEDSGRKTYEQACSACHANGLAGAPKIGDIEIWIDRLDDGKEPLYLSAINGKGAMPAKGGQFTLSDQDIKEAVDYMVSQSQ